MSSESSMPGLATAATRRSQRPGRAHRWLLAALHLILLAVFLRILASGLDYYLTPLQQRPRHELYWILKPGGERGHLLGIAGSVMMSVMLLYSARKRWSRLRRAGPLAVWLDYHILLGVWGPLFVVLHSSFKVQGLVSVSFWSMVAVAASGVFGRFLYVQIPRSMAGDELSLAQARELDEALSWALSTDFGLDREEIAQVEAIAKSGLAPGRPLIVLLARLAVDPWRVRLRLRRLRRKIGAVERRAGRPLAAVVLRKAVLHRRLLLLDRLRELFHYWHVLHKPFALLMYLFMVVHIAVAWMTGYAWGGR
jgi:cytochrome b561